MKRRIISLLLVVLLLLPAAVTMADKNPPYVTFTSQDVQGNVGETVTVTLNIDIVISNVGQTLDSLQFVLAYDSSALEFVEIQEVSKDRIMILGVQYMCNVATNTGKVAFAAASVDGAAGNGLLMHVKFKVLSPISTMLSLKDVRYSFVNSKGVQTRRQDGTINLQRITGQNGPATIAPATADPIATPLPSHTPEINGTEPPATHLLSERTKKPKKGDLYTEQESNNVLGYIVIALFVVVAILICVVLTLMIVHRGRNKARVKYFEDDEDDESRPMASGREDLDEEDNIEEPFFEEDEPDEDGEDEPPIRIVRRSKK